MIDKKRDANIQLIRIIAMFSIILCHCFNEIGNSLVFLGQLFNVGVFIFFIISGYLYGKKNIDKPFAWLLKKFLQICIPIYIWLVVMNIIYLWFHTNINPLENLIYIFNLQAFINNGLVGLNHLWFISIILILYMITPLLNKYKNKKYNKSYLLITTGVLYIIGSFMNQDIGRYLFYVLLYMYIYMQDNKDSIYLNKNKKRILYVICTILAVTVRLVGKHYLDDTLIYTNFIVLLSQTIIAISVFRFLLTININNNKIISFFDNSSYYIYIVHYVFCVGPLKIIQTYSSYFVIQVIVLFIVSTVIALILNRLSRIIINSVKGR